MAHSLWRMPAVLALLALAACATPASRIAGQQARFDSYPPEIQEKIRAGQVGLGYTPEMVRMALGEPDRQYTRETAEGKSEVWAYRDSKPSFGFGLGLGSFGSHVGGGVGVNTTVGDGGSEKLRVIFKDQAVVLVERDNPAP